MGNSGSTPIHKAAKEGSLSELYVAVQENPTRINEREKDFGYTALHVASWQGFDVIVRELLQRGAQPDILDNEGRTALHLAALKGHAEVVKALLRANARKDVLDKLQHRAYDYAYSRNPQVAELIGPPPTPTPQQQQQKQQQQQPSTSSSYPNAASAGTTAGPFSSSSSVQLPQHAPVYPQYGRGPSATSTSATAGQLATHMPSPAAAPWSPQAPAHAQHTAHVHHPSSNVSSDSAVPAGPLARHLVSRGSGSQQQQQQSMPSSHATLQPQQSQQSQGPAASTPPSYQSYHPPPHVLYPNIPSPVVSSASTSSQYMAPDAAPSAPVYTPITSVNVQQQQQQQQQAQGSGVQGLVSHDTQVSENQDQDDDWSPVEEADWGNAPDKVPSTHTSHGSTSTTAAPACRPQQPVNPLSGILSAADRALQQFARLSMNRPMQSSEAAGGGGGSGSAPLGIGGDAPPWLQAVAGVAGAAAAFVEAQRARGRKDKQEGGHDSEPGRVRVSSSDSQQQQQQQPPGRLYRYSEVAAATNYFAAANKIGEGGYGSVYRGVLDGIPVAVKVMDKGPGAMQGVKEFTSEVNILTRLHHPHVVLLIGSCPDKGLLVYELMEGGSLEDRLFKANKSVASFLTTTSQPRSSTASSQQQQQGVPQQELSGGVEQPLLWWDRVRIAVEIATALLYLHSSAEPIVHMDLKPANVLLDSHGRAKLGDVGLARLIRTGATAMGAVAGILNRTLPDAGPSAGTAPSQEASQLVGTPAYVDPQYLATGRFSTKSDLYALGVILLQLLTGLPQVREVMDMVDRARRNVLQFAYIIDRLAGPWPAAEAMAFADVALKCIQPMWDARPDLRTEVLPTLLQLRQRSGLYPQQNATQNTTNQSVLPADVSASSAPGYPHPTSSSSKSSDRQQDAQQVLLQAAMSQQHVAQQQQQQQHSDHRLSFSTKPPAATFTMQADSMSAYMTDADVPAMFMCPITQDVMEDPVVAADGYSYEREAIQAWFTKARTSPLTNLTLEHTNLVPNMLLRSAIREWQERQASRNAQHAVQ